jgi:hypothetical protein
MGGQLGTTPSGTPPWGYAQSGAPVIVPYKGQTGNLAWSLHELKQEFGEHGLVTGWCAAHRVDLVPDALDKVPEFAILLAIMRSLSWCHATCFLFSECGFA